jgi:ribosomal protein L37AE/L43A
MHCICHPGIQFARMVGMHDTHHRRRKLSQHGGESFCYPVRQNDWQAGVETQALQVWECRKCVEQFLKAGVTEAERITTTEDNLVKIIHATQFCNHSSDLFTSQ